mgnify:CR=1 FL=1
MPDNDEATSLGAIGGSAQNGAVAFATTHWSVVLTAQDESPAAQEALEKLCRAYWRPIFSFDSATGCRARGGGRISRRVFALLLERRDLSAVRKEKGRLCSYLLVSLKHFWPMSAAVRWRSSEAKDSD